MVPFSTETSSEGRKKRRQAPDYRWRFCSIGGPLSNEDFRISLPVPQMRRFRVIGIGLMILTGCGAGGGAATASHVVAPVPPPPIASPPPPQPPPVSGIEVSRRVVAAVFQWPDAIDVADLNGDGRLDLVSGGGHPDTRYTVRVYFQQENLNRWREQIIFEGEGRIQGAAVFRDPRSGRPIVFSADQLNGQVRVHAGLDPQWGSASTGVVISGRPWIQSIVALDLDADGVDEIVYAWEGTGPDSGGVNLLRLSPGADPALPASWQDVPLVMLEGAWAIREPILLDLDRDGRANELLVGARRAAGGARNAASRPGLYYLKIETLSAGTVLARIGEAGRDPINFARGRFFGRGSNNDVAIVDRRSNTIRFLETEAGRATFTLELPNLPDASATLATDGWNITTIPDPSNSRARDALIVVGARSDESMSGLFGVYWDGSAYRFQLLEEWRYGHPMDNRIMWADLDRDGSPEMIAPDSGGNQILIYNFRFR